MTIYNYTVTGADHMTLVAAINATDVTIDGLSVNGDDVNVAATGLSGGQVTVLDNIISGFNPVSLAVNKSGRIRGTKGKTNELIDAGFNNSNSTFSLSRQDLTYYRSVYNSIIDGNRTLPVSILDILGNAVNFTLIGDLDTLVKDGEAARELIINGQHTLINSINDAANQTALDAVTDSRV